MSNFQRLKDVEEMFVHELENRLNSVENLPWSKLVQPVFVSQDDAYTMIHDEIGGVLPAMGKRDSFKAITMPTDDYREHEAIAVGGIVRFTEDDINEKSGNLTIPNTTIHLRRSPGETKAQMNARALDVLQTRAMNTFAKAAGEWLQGEIAFEDVNGIEHTYTTSVTDGGAVPILWSSANAATAVPIQDMEAIDVALEALPGNYGRTIEYGHTVMSREILRNLYQLDQIQRLPYGDSLRKITSLGELQELPSFYEYFGQVIAQNVTYVDESLAYIKALESDHIYVASGTQRQPVGKIAIAPGGITDQFKEGRGFTIRTNEIQPRSLDDRYTYEVALQANLIMVEYSPIYKKQVL